MAAGYLSTVRLYLLGSNARQAVGRNRKEAHHFGAAGAARNAAPLRRLWLQI
jgi:hypothetical protein